MQIMHKADLRLLRCVAFWIQLFLFVMTTRVKLEFLLWVINNGFGGPPWRRAGDVPTPRKVKVCSFRFFHFFSAGKQILYIINAFNLYNILDGMLCHVALLRFYFGAILGI